MSKKWGVGIAMRFNEKPIEPTLPPVTYSLRICHGKDVVNLQFLRLDTAKDAFIRSIHNMLSEESNKRQYCSVNLLKITTLGENKENSDVIAKFEC